MRKKVFSVTAICLALSLSACSEDPVLPSPQAQDAVEAVVTPETFGTVVERTATELKASDDKKDARQVSAYLNGAFRHERTAQYTMARIMGDSYKLSPVVLDPQATAISSGTAFPRTMVAFSGPTEEETLSTLTVWSQDAARSNYSLWASVRLFPSIPDLSLMSELSDVAGYPEVDATDYVADPAAVTKAYSSYVVSRKQGDIAFEVNDSLFTEIHEQVKTMSDSLGDLGTARVVAATPPVEDTRAISTRDGGLVLVGQLAYALQITKAEEDATLRLGSAIGALAKRDADGVLEVDDPVDANYITSVAFYIPPAGSDQSVQVIGASTPVLKSVTQEQQ